jgi:dCTP diphosphatase
MFVMETLNFTKLKYQLKEFARERDWIQFHNPKNLAMALSVEAGELVEIYQWLSEKQAIEFSKDPIKKSEISNELADILLYLTLLASNLDINLVEAVNKKFTINAKKYPAPVIKPKLSKFKEEKNHNSDLSKVFLKNF